MCLGCDLTGSKLSQFSSVLSVSTSNRYFISPVSFANLSVLSCCKSSILFKKFPSFFHAPCNLVMASHPKENPERKSVPGSAAHADGGPSRKKRRTAFDGEGSSTQAPSSAATRKTTSPAALTDIKIEKYDGLPRSFVPTNKVIGFLGLQFFGKIVVKKLLESKHKVHMWDEDWRNTGEFQNLGATVHLSPMDVMRASDIVFCCVASETMVKHVFYNPRGILNKVDSSKAYIEMTTMSPEKKSFFGEEIQIKGGRFLDLQVIGTKEQGEKGQLVTLMSGNKTLSEDIKTCLQSISSVSFFCGEKNNRATEIALILNMGITTQYAALGEMLALADVAGVHQKSMLDVIGDSKIHNQVIADNGDRMINGESDVSVPLNLMTLNSTLCVRMSDNINQQLPLGATVANMLKQAGRRGCGECDISTIYMQSRF